jgi:hypothetical protein
MANFVASEDGQKLYEIFAPIFDEDRFGLNVSEAKSIIC